MTSPSIRFVEERPLTVENSTSYWMCFVLLICITFLQKIAVPGSGSVIPLSLLILIAVCVVGWISGQLVVDPTATVGYAILLVTFGLCFLLRESYSASFASLALVLVAHIPYVFRFQPFQFNYSKLLTALSAIAAVISIFGVAQFLAQFVVGVPVAFFLDVYLPDAIRMIGFNDIAPLYYDSPIMRSNGFFLLEPSFFSQLVALGLICELLTQARFGRFVVLGAGLVCSYSGTGLLLIIFFAPILLIAQRRLGLLLFLAITPFFLTLFAEALNIEAFTRRIDEFSSPQSSGFARFVSIFYLLGDFVFTSNQAILFGRGPGTISEYFDFVAYEAHDPTWGKVMYEYGLVGFVSYLVFFFLCVLRIRGRALAIPLTFSYFLLGGNLVSPIAHVLLLVFVVWTADQAYNRSGRLPS